MMNHLVGIELQESILIEIKTQHEIEMLRAAGKIVAQTFLEIKPAIKPGAVLRDIDAIAENSLRNKALRLYIKVYASCPHQRPFPGVITSSINNQICHGIPDDRVLKNGDIVGIDIGLQYKGWCGDSCYTFEIGKVKPEVHRLVETTTRVITDWY